MPAKVPRRLPAPPPAPAPDMAHGPASSPGDPPGSDDGGSCGVCMSLPSPRSARRRARYLTTRRPRLRAHLRRRVLLEVRSRIAAPLRASAFSPSRSDRLADSTCDLSSVAHRRPGSYQLAAASSDPSFLPAAPPIDNPFAVKLPSDRPCSALRQFTRAPASACRTTFAPRKPDDRHRSLR
ncbi:hypothetical protein DMC30DRAFT_73129 [Rhodotorula diobovata]|uniref:Uncharacterized protein n=1 Tax=Rhodotorula diobovata TaxID=5288 RepID=A0A5C5FQA4_9BASI|nr:hypothetical protein DMC30DRAFT_73129 [Rhodotorula diobovata]